MGKVIHWELCKELKFDITNKYISYYMQNTESAQDNETHKLF